MSKSGAPRRRDILIRFVLGIAYLAFISASFSAGFRQSFPLVFAVVLLASAFMSFVVLVIAARMALRESTQRWQLDLGTLLLLTVPLAIFLGGIRWLISIDKSIDDNAQTWFAAIMFGAFLLVTSLPFLICFLEGLLWFGVWITKQPRVRKIMIRLRR